MKRILKCKCGEETWYEDISNVYYVDAWRVLEIKCKCGAE